VGHPSTRILTVAIITHFLGLFTASRTRVFGSLVRFVFVAFDVKVEIDIVILPTNGEASRRAVRIVYPSPMIVNGEDERSDRREAENRLPYK
jgi:Zn-dependent membrane protease YugP